MSSIETTVYGWFAGMVVAHPKTMTAITGAAGLVVGWLVGHYL